MTSSGPRPPAAETSLGALGAQEAAPVVIAMWPWVALAGLCDVHGLNSAMGW